MRNCELGAEHGSALVEHAIVLTALLSLMFGVMDFSRFIYTYTYVCDAARQGTRYASVRGATFSGTSCTTTSTYACDATAANVTSYVQSLTPPAITSSSVTVTATWPATTPDGSSCSTANTAGCYVKVVVSYPFHFMLPFLPKAATTYTLSSTSEMVIAQ